MYTSKKAFTIAELIIAIAISVIVLFFIATFISDSISTIGTSTSQSTFLSNFEDVKIKMNNYKTIFLSGSLLINNSSTGSDVVLLKDPQNIAGVVFGVVDKNTNFLEQTQTGYTTYYDKVLGYRDISSQELSELITTPNKIYTYKFYNDKLFNEMKIKDFQAKFYNNGTILDLDLQILNGYLPSLSGSSLNSLRKTDFTKYNLNF